MLNFNVQDSIDFLTAPRPSGQLLGCNREASGGRAAMLVWWTLGALVVMAAEPAVGPPSVGVPVMMQRIVAYVGPTSKMGSYHTLWEWGVPMREHGTWLEKGKSRSSYLLTRTWLVHDARGFLGCVVIDVSLQPSSLKWASNAYSWLQQAASSSHDVLSCSAPTWYWSNTGWLG